MSRVYFFSQVSSTVDERSVWRPFQVTRTWRLSSRNYVGRLLPRLSKCRTLSCISSTSPRQLKREHGQHALFFSLVFFFSDATRGKLFHNGVGHGTTKSRRSLTFGTLADSTHELLDVHMEAQLFHLFPP